ncbi:hypothetical protein ACQP0C_12790 [Nocardia sp. CA-129566]|uniref:hypothetical protein n=1 Tax=Nocardia sp. CA-129566 TaxID=3239976 RepID=UPI003D99F167
MSWWKTALSTTVSVALPIVGNMIVPGAGGIIGGAVANIASDAINGKIHGVTDVLTSAGEGALFSGGAGKIVRAAGAPMLGGAARALFRNSPNALAGASVVTRNALRRSPISFGARVANNARAMIPRLRNQNFRYPMQTAGQVAGSYLATRFDMPGMPGGGSGGGGGGNGGADTALKVIPTRPAGADMQGRYYGDKNSNAIVGDYNSEGQSQQAWPVLS